MSIPQWTCTELTSDQVSISIGHLYPGVTVLGHVVILCLNIRGATRLLSRMTALFHLLSCQQGMPGSVVSLQPFQHLLSVFQIFSHLWGLLRFLVARKRKNAAPLRKPVHLENLHTLRKYIYIAFRCSYSVKVTLTTVSISERRAQTARVTTEASPVRAAGLG